MARDCERHVNDPETASGKDWTLRRALALLAAGAVVICWPWLSGRASIPWDAKAHFLPQVQFLAQSLAASESPFWTPFVFSGHPQIADAQSLIFSPPMLLLALLNPAPTPWAMDITLFMSVAAGAAAFMIWLNDKGVHPAASLIAALGFAFGAAMAWRIQHVGQVLSLSYLPFVLLFLDRALARRSLRYAFAAGAAAAVLVLGRDQVALLAVYLLIGRVLWYWLDGANRAQRVRGSLPPLIVAGLVGTALIALPILMTSLLAAGSNRPSIDLEGAGRGSLHPALFLTAFAPDVFGSSGVMGEYWGPPSLRWQGTGLYIAQNMGQFYFGAAAMLALVLGALTGALFEKRAVFFTIALVIAVLYALGWYTPAFQAFHAYVPGVNLYRRPADAVFVIGFLASVLAAFSLDRLLSGRPARETPGLARIAAAVISAFAVMIGLRPALRQARRRLAAHRHSFVLFAAAGGLLWGAQRLEGEKRNMLLAALALFTVFDLAYSNGPGGATALPPETFEVLEPKTRNDTIALLKAKVEAGKSETRRDRVELVGFGFHWPNASLTHGLENTLGYNPVRLADYSRALGAGDHAGLPEQKGFSPLLPSYRSRLADLLGLRYIATSVPVETIDKALKPGDLTLVAKTSDGYVYENLRALNRVLFATRAVAADFNALLETGSWPDIDFNTTVLLEGEPGPAAARAAGARTDHRLSQHARRYSPSTAPRAVTRS